MLLNSFLHIWTIFANFTFQHLLIVLFSWNLDYFTILIPWSSSKYHRTLTRFNNLNIKLTLNQWKFNGLIQSSAFQILTSCFFTNVLFSVHNIETMSWLHHMNIFDRICQVRNSIYCFYTNKITHLYLSKILVMSMHHAFL